jgi:hypothetical protein
VTYGVFHFTISTFKKYKHKYIIQMKKKILSCLTIVICLNLLALHLGLNTSNSSLVGRSSAMTSEDYFSGQNSKLVASGGSIVEAMGLAWLVQELAGGSNDEGSGIVTTNVVETAGAPQHPTTLTTSDEILSMKKKSRMSKL